MKACPLCAEQIQDAAVRCKHCGAMLNKADPSLHQEVGGQAPAQPKVTTERTSKRLKKWHAIGSLIFVIGFIRTLGSCMATDGQVTSIGAIFMAVGFVWYVVTRIRIWWHHG